MEQTKNCIDCNIDKSIDQFYTQKGHLYNVMSYCKSCFNARCTQRWIKRKQKAIEDKGNHCERCNLNITDSHYSVFEFHHKDKTQKDYDWTKLRLQSADTIKKELDKCILLCANCHRLVHSLDFPDQLKSH